MKTKVMVHNKNYFKDNFYCQPFHVFKQGWENNLYTTLEVIDIERDPNKDEIITCTLLWRSETLKGAPVSGVGGSAFRSVFWELHFVGMFIRCSTPNSQKPQIFLVYLSACMIPEHKIRWGISENGRPTTPVSILFFQNASQCFFSWYPPGITEFSKTKKSCCRCSFESCSKIDFWVWACWRAANCGPSNGWLTSPLHSGHGRT